MAGFRAPAARLAFLRRPPCTPTRTRAVALPCRSVSSVLEDRTAAKTPQAAQKDHADRRVDHINGLKQNAKKEESVAPVARPRPEDVGVIFRADLRNYFRLASALAMVQCGWWVSFATAYDLPADTLPTVRLETWAGGVRAQCPAWKCDWVRVGGVG